MKMVKAILGIILGVLLIPAIYSGIIAAVGLLVGFISNPKVVLVVVIIFGLINLPGLIIGWLNRPK